MCNDNVSKMLMLKVMHDIRNIHIHSLHYDCNRSLSLKPARNNPDENRGCFVYKGRKENFDIEYGSCETAHIRDSEGIERHLEAPISLTGKKGKKEEPKTNT